MAFNNIIVHILLVCFTVFTNVTCQTLEYTLTEQDNRPVVMDIIKDSGLEKKYSPEILSTIKLNLVDSELGYNNYFSINSTGYLTAIQTINREEFCAQKVTCVITLDVEVAEPREYWEIIKVNINVLDKNDNSPKFDTAVYEVDLSEVSVPPVQVSLPIATDQDSPVYGIKQYKLSGAPDTFSLNIVTNVDGSLEPSLKLDKQLDREKVATYSLELRAMDGGSPQKTGIVAILVNVIDVNDQYPVFKNKSYEISVHENLPAWTNILTTTATDKDEGVNGEIVYSLKYKNQAMSQLFEINENSGDIYVIGDLDYEQQTSYTLTVVAKNKGQSSLTSQAKVLIHLTDINDNSPVIKLKTAPGKRVNVPENQPVGTFVAHISVTDKDSGVNGKFNCTTYSEFFALERINDNDFKIVTKVILNRELKQEYIVDVACEDFGSRSLTSHQQVPITVTDINDNPPIFEHNIYKTQVEETDQVGQQVMIVKATDKDLGDNGRITYSLYSPSDVTKGLFQIDPVLGSIRNIKPLDHELRPQINLKVFASDNGIPAKNASASIVIDLIDKDDEPPLFNKTTYNFAVHENKPINTYVDHVEAIDPDSTPFNHIYYSIQKQFNDLPFRIDQDTGDIFTTDHLDRESKSSYSFMVMAQGPSPGLLGSTVKVNIFVADDNDHSPRFVFPNSVNNTVYVNPVLKAGAIITSIYGEDKDAAKNALLHYSIIDDVNSDAFTVDEYSGMVTVTRDYKAEVKSIVLSVTVTDSGPKQFSDSTYLNVVFIDQSTSGDVNQDIVIGIAVVASIIVTVLVLTIVCLLCRRQKLVHKQRTLAVLKTTLQPSAVQQVDPLPVVERFPNTLDTSYQSSSAEKSSLHGGYLNNGLVYDPERDSIVVQRQWAEENGGQDHSQQKLVLGRPQSRRPMDDDSDSACSLGDSNTDSGRGSHDDHNVTDPAILYPRPVLSYTTQSTPVDHLQPVLTKKLHPGVHQNKTNIPKSSSNRAVTSQDKQPRALDYRRDSYRNILDKALEQREGNVSHDRQSHDSKPAQTGHKQNNLRAYQEAKKLQLQRQLQLHGMPKKSVHYCSQV